MDEEKREVPESLKNLSQRRADQIASSRERCVAAGESIAFTTKIVLVSQQMIGDSRAKIGRAEPMRDRVSRVPRVHDR
jgi:hypothetical protein